MKIKFRALCLAALVVVMAFASVASAATFVGATKAGTVQTFTVDLSDGGTPLSRKSAVSLAPNLMSSADRHNDLKFFGIPGKVFAVSTDTGDGQLGSYLYEFTVNADGNPAYSKTLDATSLVLGLNGRGTGARAASGSTTGGVRRVVDFKGDPVFIGQSAFAVLLNDTNIKSLDVSVDLAFVHNDKLYIINSNKDNSKSYIQSVSSITTGTKSTDIADVVIGTRNTGKSELLSYAINGESKIDWKTTTERGTFSTVVTEKYVYLASEKGVYKIELTETDVLHSPKVEKTVLQGEFLAMTSEGETIYAWKKLGGVYYLVAVSTGSDAETELHRMTNEEWSIPDVAPSFDICYNPSDKVIGVVAHASPMASVSGLAVFIPSTTQTNKWDLYHVDSDFQSAALLASTSTTPDTPDTPATDSTVVDPTSLTDDQKASLKDASGGEAADFVTTATEATGTTPDSTVTANVRSAAGTGFESAPVAAVKNYTLASDGYILVKAAGYNAANVKVFFVPVNTSSATVAADSTSEGVLLDSSYAKITSGTSAFASSAEKLTAGTYTLVTATKTASTTPEDEGSDTGSSSSGCDAGFGLMSLAALLAVTTISKRR